MIPDDTAFLRESEDAHIERMDRQSRAACYWVSGFAIAMMVYQLLRAFA